VISANARIVTPRRPPYLAYQEDGGLSFGLDALQPEGHGSLLYVLYEGLSGTPVGAVQMEPPPQNSVPGCKPIKAILATLSDGEDTLIAALKQTWADASHQRCQAHFLANLADARTRSWITRPHYAKPCGRTWAGRSRREN